LRLLRSAGAAQAAQGFAAGLPPFAGCVGSAVQRIRAIIRAREDAMRGAERVALLGAESRSRRAVDGLAERA